MTTPLDDNGNSGQAGDVVFERRDWLQITLSCIGDGVIAADAMGRVNYLNPIAEKLTGWTLAHAAGNDVEQVFRIVNETTRKPVEQPARKVIERGLTVGLGNHTLLIARDGSERPIDDSAAAIKDDRGNVVGVVLIFRDITERRHAERIIESARQYAESIVTTVREPLLVLDAELHVKSANPAFYETFQVAPAETEGRFIYDLGDGQWNIPALRTLLEEILPRHLSFADFEVEHDFEHIGPKTMLLNGRCFPPESHYDFILLAIEDITERKRMADAVTASEVRYRRLFEAARDGILILDPDVRRITDANPFMVELLGYPRDELVGKELWEIGLLKDEEASREAFDELQSTGSIRYEDLPLQSKIGTRREVEFVSNVYQENGHMVVQCNIRDITDRKRLEEERERLYRVAEEARTRAEANEAQLSEADRRKNEFLAMLAHELRNPLAAITSANEVSIRTNADDERDWADGVIKRQVNQLRRLVDDLLDVSRISEDKVLLQKEPVELQVIIDRATEVVRPLIREKGHQLTAAQPPIPLLLNADPGRLEQILVNLLTNAAKYTKPGGQIELSTRRDRDELVITVHDSGVGISPEMLPRIFDLFTQVDASLDRSQGGLGIGLTLVRRLVELHGGSVSVASEGEGKGSEFVVRLPAALDEATLEAPLTNSARPDANPQRSRVLVVDDDLDIGRGMARLLKVSGHDVQTAHDGPSAIEIARTQHPDAILLDIGLPGMNGFEVVKVLRQDEGCKDTILIAVSGYGQEDDRRRSHEAGFHHHLVKPINYDELLTLLTRPSPAPPT